ncbi:MAG: ABC transporter substrate-binding protein [Alphaproteobacteria bacterium]|nr:ABC transporter substrate-binding protein [Alphaproteobacteria bacterium]
MNRSLKHWLIAAAMPLAMAAGAAQADNPLRVVMLSDLKIVDPIWTTAYMSRNYGYMVYDTLFAMDEKLNIEPQMVDSYSISDDELTYTFKLRGGLRFHDGAEVTSDDVIASLQRWGKKDSMGQKLMEFTASMTANSADSFTIKLQKPFGLTLMAMAKPSSNVPFIMPKRVADTPADKQITDYVGSGPFIFNAAAWKPGDTVVFDKNKAYVPRGGAPSWAAGGKTVMVDRVEWVSMPDQQTAVNALIAGEIDYIESPPTDLLPLLEAEADVVSVVNLNPLGLQYMFRLNHLHPPFDNVKIRRAALAAINQEDFLKAAIGNPKYYKACAAMFMCGTPLATDKGAEIVMKSDFPLAKKLLEEGGYDGTKIVLMHSTDVDSLSRLAPVAAQALRKAGFNVDMQSMDWQTLVSRRAKREKPAEGGWNVFMTAWVAADILNPIMAAGYGAGCDKAWFGWPCDEKMEALRNEFIAAKPADQFAVAEKIQVRAMEVVTHAHAGQWYRPSAWRKDRLSGVLEGPVPFFWNIAKK